VCVCVYVYVSACVFTLSVVCLIVDLFICLSTLSLCTCFAPVVDQAFHNAASLGHIEVVSFLVDAGADIEMKDKVSDLQCKDLYPVIWVSRYLLVLCWLGRQDTPT
jgi:hypothetical protein